MGKTIITTIGVAVLALGCGKSGDADKDKGKGVARGGGDPNVWGPLELKDLGLVAQVPGNARLGAMGGITTSDHACDLDVFPVTSSSEGFDNMVANVERGNNGGPLKTMIKKEKTDDANWIVVWDTNDRFGYALRQPIGGKAYTCVGYQFSTAAARDCSMKICQSLAAK